MHKLVRFTSLYTRSHFPKPLIYTTFLHHSTQQSNNTQSTQPTNHPIPPFLRELQKDKLLIKKYDVEWYEQPQEESFQWQNDIWENVLLPDADKIRLSYGRDRKFLKVGECFAFPSFRDCPVRFSSTQRAYLWIDPQAKQDKILFQMTECFPPLLWIPLRPSTETLKKLFDELIDLESASVSHRLEFWEEMLTHVDYDKYDKEKPEQAEELGKKMIAYINDIDPKSIKYEHLNTCHLYMGNVEDEKDIEKSFMNNPFVFSTPMILGSSNKFSNGKVIVSKFRTIYSRSIIDIEVRKDLGVELGGIEPNRKALGSPVFARINYPTTKLLSKPCATRMNNIFSTDYPEDMPVDVIAAMLGNAMRSFLALRRELSEKEAKDESIPAFAIAHLAILRDPEFDKIFRRFYTHEDHTVRIACLKGAAELGLRHLVEEMHKVEKHPEIQEMIVKVISEWR